MTVGKPKKRPRKDSFGELKTFITENTDPKLQDFLTSKANLVHQESHKSAKHLKINMTRRFNAALEKQKPSLLNKGLETVEKHVWVDVFDPVTNYNFDEDRHILFKWAYLLFRNEDPEKYLVSIRTSLNNMQNKNSTLPEALNNMSISLMSNFSSLGYLRQNALKMSLSHIVDLVSPNYLAIYKNQLPENLFNQLIQVEATNSLSSQDQLIIKQTVQDFVKKIDAQEFSLTTKNGLVYQLYRVLFHITSTLQNWQKVDQDTEAMHTNYLSTILVYLFDDTSIQIIPGESSSQSSKMIKEFNCRFYGTNPQYEGTSFDSYSSSNVIGKKADILLKNKQGFELAVCELKKGSNNQTAEPPNRKQPQASNPTSTTSSILPSSTQPKEETSRREEKREMLIQESKSIRTNKCIDIICRRLGALSGVMTMDFGGNVGTSYQLKQVANCTVIKHIGTPKLPININQLKEKALEQTLLNLYDFKSHVLKLDKELSTATVSTTPVIVPQVFTSPKIKPATLSLPSLPPPLNIKN